MAERHVVHQQLDHIWEHHDLFEHHTGNSGPAGLIEYFVDQIGDDKEDIYWRLCHDLGLKPRVENTSDVIHATMLWPRTGPEWSPLLESVCETHNLHMAEPKEAPVAEENDDALETRVQSVVAKALESLMDNQSIGLQSFDDALASVDPADSEAALAMLDFLLKTGRLGRVGVLDSGGGYLFMYQEPKGSSKQGYIPGATQGDRIVDKAVEAQRASGAAPTKRGVCKFCISAVYEHPEGVIVLEEPGGTDGTICEPAPGKQHAFAG